MTWPFTANLAEILDFPWRWIAIVLCGTLFASFLLLLRPVAKSRLRSGYGKHHTHPPFSRRPEAWESWLPGVVVSAVTTGFAFARLWLAPVIEARDAYASFVAPLLIAGSITLVLLCATFLRTFRLPLLTETIDRLPLKLRNFASQGIGRPKWPAESWRYLDEVPQIVRRLGMHELIFWKTQGPNSLASSISLLVWRMAPVFFSLVVLMLLPYALHVSGQWISDYKLPLSLCILNWAALSLSYYVYAGKHDLAVEVLRMHRYQHLTLFKAIGLQPDKDVISDIYPYFDAHGIKSAGFLFTVMVPMYLAFIDIFP